MTSLEKAARQALEALEDIGDEWGFTCKRTLPKRKEAITALRQALEKPAREWVGLTDEEREELKNYDYREQVVVATEAFLKEKNT